MSSVESAALTAAIILLVGLILTLIIGWNHRPERKCRVCGGSPHPGLGCGPAGAEPGPTED